MGWQLWRHPELLGLHCIQPRGWVTNACLQLEPHPQRPLQPLLGMILAFPSNIRQKGHPKFCGPERGWNFF